MSDQKTNETPTNMENTTTDTDNLEEVESEESEAKTKAGKFINKHKSKVKRGVSKTKQKLLIQLQLILFSLVALIFLSWNTVENIANKLSGFTEVTIINKTTDNGCYEITIHTQESYCLDENSYNLAQEGNTYHLEKMQYNHSLRIID